MGLLKGRVIRLTVMFLGGVCMTAALLLPASVQGSGCKQMSHCTYYDSGGTGHGGECEDGSPCQCDWAGQTQDQLACNSSEYC
jgi:hypothetical protein